MPSRYWGRDIQWSSGQMNSHGVEVGEKRASRLVWVIKNPSEVKTLSTWAQPSKGSQFMRGEEGPWLG